jgi:hypothetical protein
MLGSAPEGSALDTGIVTPPSFHTTARAFVARHWSTAASVLVAVAMVGCILCAELRLRAGTFSDLSDYWEHAAVLRALMDHPFRPSNPHLAIATSSPRFGPIAVLVALASRALGLDAPNGLSLAAVLNTALFVLGIWLFFRTYFRDRRAGLYGLLVMLGSWWEAWTFTSVYQPKVLLSVACYPWLAAFGVTLLGLAFALRVLRAQKVRAVDWVGLVCWAALVLLTHQLTAVMGLAALCLLAVTEPRVALARRACVVATAFAGCALAALWPYFSVFGLLAGGQQDAGWVGRTVQAAVEGPARVKLHRFYRWNELLPALGLGLLGVAFLPYFFLRWRRMFVGLGVLAMLGPFALNAFVPLPLGHRFVLLAVFFLHVAVVWLALALTPGSPEFPAWLDKRWLRPVCLLLVWTVLLTFGYHNVQRTKQEWNYFAYFARHGESAYMRYARSVAAVAGTQAVIMAEPRAAWPIPAFGPKVVALQHANPFVADAEQRDADVESFFSNATEQRRLEIVRQYRVSHVLVKREPRGTLRSFLIAHARREPLPAGFSLYFLTQPVP